MQIRLFKMAKPRGTAAIVSRTAVQIVIVWSFALLLLPLIAVQIDEQLGFASFAGPVPFLCGVVVFVAGSAAGIWAAWVMAVQGRGTPIPFDAARRLVVSGPYAYVRNPMALAAVAQSTAVALILGSPTALVIPAGGAVFWQLLLRPPEERFLAASFGDEYAQYCARVRNWLPRRP